MAQMKCINHNHINDITYYLLSRSHDRPSACTIIKSHDCKDLTEFLNWLHTQDIKFLPGRNYFITRDCGYLQPDK